MGKTVLRWVVLVVVGAWVSLAGGSEGAGTRLVVWQLDGEPFDVGRHAAIERFVDDWNADPARTWGTGPIAIDVRRRSRSSEPHALPTAAAGGRPPDVVFVDGAWVPALAEMRVLQPVSVASDDRGALREAFYRGCWERVVYDGEAFAVPAEVDVPVLVINRGLYGDGAPPSTVADLREESVRLTGTNDLDWLTQLGIWFAGDSRAVLRFGRAYGGQALSAEGSRCTVGDAAFVDGLTFVLDTERSLGGRLGMDRHLDRQGGDAVAAFTNDAVAMLVGDISDLSTIARVRPDMQVAVSPIPGKTGRVPAAAAGACWAMPVGAAHPALAGEFIRWMVSPEAAVVEARVGASRARARGRGFLPRPTASPVANELVRSEVVRKVSETGREWAAAHRAYLDVASGAEPGGSTSSWEVLRRELDGAIERARAHEVTPAEALATAAARVQRDLDRRWASEGRAEVPTGLGLAVMALTAVAALLLIVAVRSRAARGPLTPLISEALRRRGPSLTRAILGAALGLPWTVVYIALVVVPIVVVLLLGLTHYGGLGPMRLAFTANFVALAADPMWWRALRDTAYMSLGVPFGMAFSLALALLARSHVRTGRVVVWLAVGACAMPVVASSLVWVRMFHAQAGSMTSFAELLGFAGVLRREAGAVAEGGVPWLTSGRLVYPSLLLMGLSSIGPSLFVWLVGLRAIPVGAREAAGLDGLGWLRRVVHVTLPRLGPHAVVCGLLGLVGVLHLFAQSVVMQPGSEKAMAGFVLNRLFDVGYGELRLGYASVMALIVAVVSIAVAWAAVRLLPAWTSASIAEVRGRGAEASHV